MLHSVVCVGGGHREAWFADSDVPYTQQSLGVLHCEEKPPSEAMKWQAGASGLSAVLFLVMLLNHKSLAALRLRSVKWGIAKPRQKIEKIWVDQLSASWRVVDTCCLEDFLTSLCFPF